MGGGAGFWIGNASADDPALAATLGAWRDRIPEEHSAFLRVENDDGPPHDLMAELSLARGTDVLWVSVQSTVDAFEYVHYRGGQLVRELIYGCYGEERTWERILGTAQPWEAWPRPPTVGSSDAIEAMDHAWRVFEHYGLQGVAPKAAPASAPTRAPKSTLPATPRAARAAKPTLKVAAASPKATVSLKPTAKRAKATPAPARPSKKRPKPANKPANRPAKKRR